MWLHLIPRAVAIRMIHRYDGKCEKLTGKIAAINGKHRELRERRDTITWFRSTLERNPDNDGGVSNLTAQMDKCKRNAKKVNEKLLRVQMRRSDLEHRLGDSRIHVTAYS